MMTTMMMMMMIITRRRRRRRRRRRKTGLGLLQSMRLQEAASSRPSDKAGRMSDFALKLFVGKFSYSSIYSVNSGLRVGGGQKLIFVLGPVMSQIGPIGDKDDDDDDNDGNNKVVVKC